MSDTISLSPIPRCFCWYFTAEWCFIYLFIFAAEARWRELTARVLNVFFSALTLHSLKMWQDQERVERGGEKKKATSGTNTVDVRCEPKCSNNFPASLYVEATGQFTPKKGSLLEIKMLIKLKMTTSHCAETTKLMAPLQSHDPDFVLRL